ncbi:MAG: hypothetical protein M3P29_12960 [Acidobacteriota bacterium]|nr:hypothetical protein [Acidobacteriota bacterium]
MTADIWRVWRDAATLDKPLKVRKRHLPALSAKQVLPEAYSRERLFAAICGGQPVLFSDLRVPIAQKYGADLTGAAVKLIKMGFNATQTARVQTGPSRKRSYLRVAELMRRWEGRRAIASVTDLHIRGTRVERDLDTTPLSAFNILLCGSDAMAQQEMMTMVVSTRGNVTDSHSDDPDGSNHCFAGKKLWLAWETFEGQAAGLEDNSRGCCVGAAAFSFESFTQLRSARWWVVSDGETLFLPGHLTHRVITLEHYLGIGSFFVALPSAVQTIARWITHGPLWSIKYTFVTRGLVDEIAAAATRKMRELSVAWPAERDQWGASYARIAADRWIDRNGAQKNTLLQNQHFSELLAAAQAIPRSSSA